MSVDYQAMVGHVCEVVGYDTTARVLRALRFVKRRWRKVASAAGPDASFCREALRKMLSCHRRGSLSDLARWDLRACGDFKVLWHSVSEALPRATATREVLHGATEVMSLGYYNGSAECAGCAG